MIYSVLGDRKHTIKKGSEEESDYLDLIINTLRDISPPDEVTPGSIDSVISRVNQSFTEAWTRFSSKGQASARSKGWWNWDCAEAYRLFCDSANNQTRWKHFKCATIKAK